MAVGRRDYTWGFLNEAASEGRYKESFCKFFTVSVDSLDLKTVYTYTVPAGYCLGILKVGVSSLSGVYNDIMIAKDGAIQSICYFTGNQVIEFSDNAPLVFEEGQVLTIDISNLDEIACIFQGWIVGVLNTVIS